MMDTTQPMDNKQDYLSSPMGRSRELPDDTIAQAVEELVLPSKYGNDTLVLLYQDTHTLYSYWEVREETLRALGYADGCTIVLRVLPEDGEPFDLDASDAPDRMFINLPSGGGAYSALLGIKKTDGTFIEILSSNRVALPPVGVSAVEDESWAVQHELYVHLMGEGAEHPEGFGSHTTLAFRLHGFSSETLVKH